MSVCDGCGQLIGVDEYDEELWETYSRLRDGRQYREPLVFDGEWLNEHVQDFEDAQAVDLAMSKNMSERGLCSKCGRPNLRGVRDEDVLSLEEARELADLAAEQAAERRAGC